MGDKYEDLGPANVLPPPPPQPQQIFPQPPLVQSSQERTELRSAQLGAGNKRTAKGAAQKKALAPDEEEEEEVKYTVAQKVCMVISGIAGIFFFMIGIAAVVIMLTGFKIFS